MSVGRQPQLFLCDYKSEDFQTKLRYYEVVLGKSPRHMLVEQPLMLKSALGRADYKVSYAQPCYWPYVIPFLRCACFAELH